MSFRIATGDCLHVMAEMEPDSIDAIVTDPPYGLSFMGKDWDHGVPGTHFWQEAMRVAKPGAHLLAFGGTRTFHRLTCAVEDAGWEIRDCIMWVYGSGFPKSLDVSKAIDKANGCERPRVPGGCWTAGTISTNGLKPGEAISGEAISGEAIKWQGWGTALKPAWEPIIVARKPLAGTVAANVQEWGAGALNIDGCRVDWASDEDAAAAAAAAAVGFSKSMKAGRTQPPTSLPTNYDKPPYEPDKMVGRWPANVIHDGSEEVLRLMPEEDSGSAARFFYCAKTDRAEREIGMHGLKRKRVATLAGSDREGPLDDVSERFRTTTSANNHPTVKPIDLMQYLVRLVARKGATVLDPFTGSGSTGIAALREGCHFVGIELDPEYAEIARARIKGDAPLINVEA